MSIQHFLEGKNAYLDYDLKCLVNNTKRTNEQVSVPVSPYVKGSIEDKDWNEGYATAKIETDNEDLDKYRINF